MAEKKQTFWSDAVAHFAACLVGQEVEDVPAVFPACLIHSRK